MPRRSEGAVYRRGSDGRWVAKWRDIDGRWRYRYRRSRVEARAALRDALEQVEAGIGGSDTTLGAWIETWLDRQAGRATSEADRRYRAGLLPGWLLAVRLAELTPAQVDRALRQIAEEPAAHNQRRSPSTVAKVRGLLVQTLDQAVRWGMIARNVARMVDPPRTVPAEVEPLTLEEARQLLDTIGDHRLHSLYLTAVSCGLRRGEVLGLRWCDVDLDAARAQIRQQVTSTNRNRLVVGPPKTRRSTRTVALPAVVVAALKVRRGQWAAERLKSGTAWHENDLIWCTQVGTPTHPRNLLRHLHRACAQADIRRISFHTLRHSAATLMLTAGVPERVIMDVLGHSTASMMVRYQHVVDDLRGDAAASMNRMFGDGLDVPGVTRGVSQGPTSQD